MTDAGEFGDLPAAEGDELLLDFYEHVGDAEGKSSGHVNQDKRVHPRQQHTAESWNDATQTVRKQTQTQTRLVHMITSRFSHKINFKCSSAQREGNTVKT